MKRSQVRERIEIEGERGVVRESPSDEHDEIAPSNGASPSSPACT